MTISRKERFMNRAAERRLRTRDLLGDSGLDERAEGCRRMNGTDAWR